MAKQGESWPYLYVTVSVSSELVQYSDHIENIFMKFNISTVTIKCEKLCSTATKRYNNLETSF